MEETKEEKPIREKFPSIKELYCRNVGEANLALELWQSRNPAHGLAFVHVQDVVR
jgi:hypothetical protein